MLKVKAVYILGSIYQPRFDDITGLLSEVIIKSGEHCDPYGATTSPLRFI
jgi:hypothetical protein